MLRPYFLIFLILTTLSFGSAFFLFRKKINQKSNPYLAIINLKIGTLSLLTFLFSEFGLKHPLYYIAMLILFIYFFAPFLYLYTVGLAKHTIKYRGLHFIIPILVTTYTAVRIPFILKSTSPAGSFLFNLRYVPIDMYLFLQGGLLFMAGYIIILLFIIGHYNVHIKDVVSSLKKSNLHWLLIQLLIALLCSFSIFSANIGEYFFSDRGLNIIFVLMEYISLGLFIIFYLSLNYFTFFQGETAADKITEPPLEEGSSSSKPKYTKQRLKQEVEKEITRKLLHYMTESKPYLDPELTIHSLAASLDITAAQITMVINIHLDMNFFKFVNKYRVDYACSLLADKTQKHFNILEIALEAGFNSKSSFNSHFKNFTGTTPRAYRENNLNSSGR